MPSRFGLALVRIQIIAGFHVTVMVRGSVGGFRWPLFSSIPPDDTGDGAKYEMGQARVNRSHCQQPRRVWQRWDAPWTSGGGLGGKGGGESEYWWDVQYDYDIIVFAAGQDVESRPPPSPPTLLVAQPDLLLYGCFLNYSLPLEC